MSHSNKSNRGESSLFPAMAPALPEQILMEEILARLSIKQLVRCRCVCKSWNSQFYNPNFLSLLNRTISLNPKTHNNDDDDYLILMNYYNNNNNNDLRYGLSILPREQLRETRVNDDYAPYPSSLKLYLPLSIRSYDIHLVGSINGLVCVAFYFEGHHQFVLWNPTIRFSEKIVVPKDLVLSFDEFYSQFVYGFGWDSVTNDYKLVMVSSRKRHSSVYVYSYSSRCWSKIKDVWMGDYSFLYKCKGPTVIVDGCPYWHRWSDTILKFDVKNDKFVYLNAPNCNKCSTLVNLNDRLAFIDYSESHFVDVYRLDEHMWMKMYTIDRRVNYYEDMKLYCFTNGGEILFYGKKKLYLYAETCEIKRRHRYPNCGSCLAKSCKPKLRGSDGCGEFVVNGFSYTPSLLALPGMKALHM